MNEGVPKPRGPMVRIDYMTWLAGYHGGGGGGVAAAAVDVVVVAEIVFGRPIPLIYQWPTSLHIVFVVATTFYENLQKWFHPVILVIIDWGSQRS